MNPPEHMEEASFKPMRSALYLPASNVRAIEKARTLAADAVIFDLEDAVAPEKKSDARRHLEAAFQYGAPTRGLSVIRVNAIGSTELEADLETVSRCRPHAVLLPKVSSPDCLATFRRLMGSRQGPCPMVWCMIETPPGLSRVAEIAAASRHDSFPVQCLVVGTNDIARETGVSVAHGRLYLIPWLMNVVLAARTHGLWVLDGVWNAFQDTAGFRDEVAQGRGMGFDGKTLIHPSQLELANQLFAPSAETVEEARAIVTAFSDPAHAGRAVIDMNGRMVELLHLQMARRTLHIHEAIRVAAEG
jgi:citrate lyase subunit beta / citryl-CoA lyase